MLIEQKFQVLSIKKGKFDEEKKGYRKDRVIGFITPQVIDLTKEFIDQESEDQLMFDSYINRVQKDLKPNTLYVGKFDIPRFAQGDVNIKLIEIK